MEEFKPQEHIKFPELVQEINEMAEIDQDMRQKEINEPDFWDDSVDRKNTERMKEIVVEIGWPTISKVGEKASSNAWLLVQHADHDVEFQARCLNLMQELPKSEVSSKNIALLTDRVRVNLGQPQIYGTQFRQVAGKHVPKDIEDIETVNERRRSIGLDTLEENIERMYKKYPVK